MHRSSLMALIGLLVACAITSCSGSSTVEDDLTTQPLNLPQAWNMAGGDATQSNYFDWKGPDNGDIKWVQNQLPALTPVLETSQEMLICTSQTGIAALDVNGGLAWQYVADGVAEESVTETPDGAIHFNSRSRIISISADGQLLSDFDTGSPINRCRFDNLGRAYITVHDSQEPDYDLKALDTDGNTRWVFSPAEPSQYEFMPDGDRLLCFNKYYDLRCFDLDGNLQWTREFSDKGAHGAQVSPDGYIYLSYLDESVPLVYHLELINPDGEYVWTYSDEFEVKSGVRSGYCGLDNALYFTLVSDLYKINLDGSLESVQEDTGALLGVTTSGCAVTAIFEDPFASYDTDIFYRVFTPDGLWEQYDIKYEEFNFSILGRDRWVYSAKRSSTDYSYAQALRAVNLSPENGRWDYQSTLQPEALTISKSGGIETISQSALTSFNSSGGQVVAPVTIERDELRNTRFKGYLAALDIHLFFNTYLLTAWNRSQGVAWSLSPDQNDHFSDCLIFEGDVYLLHKHCVTKVDMQGSEQLIYEDQEIYRFDDFAIDRNGLFYLSQNDEVVAVNSAGEVLWKATPPIGSLLRIAVSPTGDVIASTEKAMAALSSTGDVLWYYAYAGKQSRTNPVIGRDGTIAVAVGLPLESTPGMYTYYSYSENELLLVDKNGALVGRVNDVGCIYQQPVVDLEGIVYTLSDEGRVSAVDSSGTILWQTELGQYMHSAPEEMLLAPSPSGGLICAHRDCVIGIGK